MIHSDIVVEEERQLRNRMKQYWNLSDADLDQAQDSAVVLAEILSEKYGYSLRQATEEIHQFVRKYVASAR